MKKPICSMILFFPILLIGQISFNIDKYVMPLVESKDFSGIICVTKNDSIVHFKSYGNANLEWNLPNTENTE